MIDRRLNELIAHLADVKDLVQELVDKEDWTGVTNAVATIRELKAKIIVLEEIRNA